MYPIGVPILIVTLCLLVGGISKLCLDIFVAIQRKWREIPTLLSYEVYILDILLNRSYGYSYLLH